MKNKSPVKGGERERLPYNNEHVLCILYIYIYMCLCVYIYIYNDWKAHISPRNSASHLEK